jgi:hypothetical protein
MGEIEQFTDVSFELVKVKRKEKLPTMIRIRIIYTCISKRVWAS